MNIEIENEALLSQISDEDRLEALGQYLSKLVKEQVSIRADLEKRWLANLDQYNGRYDEITWQRLKKSTGSRVFINITRPKTLAAEARLADMLFPSDDKNWAIQPTPIPQSPYLPTEQQEALQQEAEARCLAMEKEIDDQLVEADYHRIAREVIHDACVFGTGVLKGVTIKNKVMQSYQQVNGAVYELVETSEFVPSCERVEVWDFFPDMSARHISDCEFVLERRYLSRSQLKRLAKQQGYHKDKIKELLRRPKQRDSASDATHIEALRVMSELSVSLDKDRFEVWEYHGVLNAEDLKACSCEVDDDDLEEHSAVIVFVEDLVIKAELNVDETGDLPYSVMIYEKDDTSIFGFGIPHLLENEQRTVNAAWRMMLDNAALSAKPQVILNREMVLPADGSWELSSGKLWFLNSEIGNVRDVFATHEINGHQSELINIFELAKQTADEVTNLPLIAQGSGDLAPDTAAGTSMLMNAANTVLRRIVKYFDDNVTEPFISRFYHWNMQYSDKADIKGDFNVDARGSSVLLVKETQNQALQQLLMIAQQPSYAPLTKHAELYRKAVQSQHIKADDVIKSDDEIAQAQQQPDPLQELEKAKLQAEIDKTKAEVTVKNVEGMYSAINAAKEVAVLPAIATMSDEIYKSAGGQDYNGFPLVENPQAVSGVPPQDRLNTHPQFPPNPDVGMMTGIDS